MTQQTVDLQIGGMTCASCAARIEKKLNRMPGVSATVNYATEKRPRRAARGHTGRGGDRHRRGHRLHRPPAASRPARPADRGRCRRRCEEPEDAEVRSLRQRLMISAVLTAPVLVLAMIPASAVRQLAVALAHPGRAGRGVGGVAVPPRAPWTNAAPRRGDHGHADQPRRARRVRLVAVCAVLRRGRDAGHADALRADPRAGVRRPTRSTWRSPPRSRCSSWPAATWRPGPRSGPARRCARCWSWAPRTSRCCATAASSASRSTSWPSVTGSWSGPGRRSPPTARSSRARPRSMPACSPANRCRSRSAPATRWSGATVNAGGRLVVRATRVGADTQLAQIARLVDGRPVRQGAGAAAGRPGLGGVRARRHRARAGHARRTGWRPVPARRWRSPPRSRC